MFEKFIFDVSPYNTIRGWFYFKEEEFHFLDNSPAKKAFDYLCCWGGWDKRESGMVSWEFPVSLAEFFYERYKLDSRADVEYLKKFLGK